MASVPHAVPQPNTILRYNNGAVLIHWLTAALVAAQIYVGIVFGEMERGPARGEWFTWHKTLGVTILILAFVRLAWRLSHRPPPFPPELPRWERLAAVWNHRAFYVVLFALPLTGLLAISGGADQATTGLVGGLRLPLIPGVSEGLGDAAGGLHVLLVFATFVLLALHIGAALKHQFLDRTRSEGRMWPFRERDGTPTAPVD